MIPVIDFAAMTSAELRELSSTITGELGLREKQDIENARNQIRAIAESVGMPVLELIAGIPASGKTKPAAVAKPRVVVPVKYRNPENSEETWTGRGRTPNWMQQKLDAGIDKSTLVVAA